MCVCFGVFGGVWIGLGWCFMYTCCCFYLLKRFFTLNVSVFYVNVSFVYFFASSLSLSHSLFLSLLSSFIHYFDDFSIRIFFLLMEKRYILYFLHKITLYEGNSLLKYYYNILNPYNATVSNIFIFLSMNKPFSNFSNHK